MKIILSRKGFDLVAGGIPSPILENKHLCYLPIPDDPWYISMGDLAFRGNNIADITKDLSRGRVTRKTGVHLDPDINRSHISRPPGWRPAFGQTGVAQAHLKANHVGPGDVFIFFGWYRAAEHHEDRWRFVPGALDIHAIFGYLQVGRVLYPTVNKADRLKWLSKHAHIRWAKHYGEDNCIYAAADRVSLPGLRRNLCGGGVFERFVPELQLTKPGHKRSVWLLPKWFAPTHGRTPLTYHADYRRWTSVGNGAVLRTVGRGQEFVLDADQYPEAIPWLAGIIESNSKIT